MELSIEVDVEDLKARLREILGGRAIDKATVSAVRRSANRAASEAVKQARTRGVLRRIFGKNATGLRKLIYASRVTHEGHDILITLKARGLAALSEQGGFTKPHVIKPKLANVLRFTAAGGTEYSAVVKHPGGMIPAHPVLGPEAAKVPAAAIAEIRAALVALWQKGAA